MSEVQSHFSCCKDDASCVCNLIQFNLMHLCCIIWYSYDAISGPLSLLTSSMTRRWDLLPSLITLSTSAISATRGGRPNYRRQRCYKCGGWCQGQDVRCKCARPNNIRSQPLIIKLQRGQEGSSRQTFFLTIALHHFQFADFLYTTYRREEILWGYLFLSLTEVMSLLLTVECHCHWLRFLRG